MQTAVKQSSQYTKNTYLGKNLFDAATAVQIVSVTY